MSRVFVDTNLLIYSVDDGDPPKRDKAQALWDELLISANTPVISTQILQEFYNTMSRKMGITPQIAKEKLLLLKHVETVLLTPTLIYQAIDLNAVASISFWDALVVSAAQSAHCAELWSEDMQDGRKFGSLEVVNPLARR